MTRYHINPNTGNPNICRASVMDCPIGGAHYKSEKDARAGFEAIMKDDVIKNIIKKSEEDAKNFKDTQGHFSDKHDLARGIAAARGVSTSDFDKHVSATKEPSQVGDFEKRGETWYSIISDQPASLTELKSIEEHINKTKGLG